MSCYNIIRLVSGCLFMQTIQKSKGYGDKMKKIISIVISVVLMFVCMSSLAVSAAVGDELLSNGGFETVSGSSPSGIGAYGNWGGSYISLQKTEVHSGTYAAKITTTSGGNPYISIPVNNIEGGCKYQMTLWYKGTTTGSKGFSVKFEEYSSAGRNVNSPHAPTYKTSASWKQVTYTYYAHDDAVRVSIMPRLYADSGEIYVDDISFKMIEGPEQFKFSTDQFFYYDEYTHAEATVELDDYYDNIYTVDFSIKSGTTVLQKVEDVPFVDYFAKAKLDITALEKKKTYRVYADIYDNEGTKVTTFSKELSRMDRPTAFNEDGVFIKDGKPFYPTILYHASIEDEDLDKAVANGINVIQNTSTDVEFLDKCYEKGIMVLQVMYFGMRPAGHTSNVADVQRTVNQIKDHPALYGYMIMDEPYAHGVTETELIRSYRIIRNIDDVHPVYVMIANPAQYKEASKFCDCLAIDPYPGNGGDYGRMVGDMSAAAREGTGYKKPVYNVLQAFTFGLSKPTQAQMRSMMYQSVMGGAQGMGYYPWIPDNEEVDDALPDSIYWPVITDYKLKDYDLMWKFYGGYDKPEKFNTSRHNDLWYDSFVVNNDIYVTVLNRTASDKSVTIPLTSTNGKIVISNYTASVVNGGELSAVTQNSGSFDIALTPYQAVMYKITPTVAPDYSKLNDIALNGSFETLNNGTLSGWGFAMGASQSSSLISTGASDGQNCIYLTGTAGARVDTTVTGEPGKAYKLSLDYKADEDDAALITIDAYPSYNQTGTRLPATGGKWKRVTYTVYASTEESASITPRLCNMSATAKVYYDNVSMIPDDSIISNFVPNGDFEMDSADETLISGWPMTTSGISIDSNKKHSGENSLKFTKSAELSTTNFVDKTGKFKFELSVSGEAGAKAEVKIITYKNNARTGDDIVYNISDITADTWNEKTFVVDIPVTTNKVSLVLTNKSDKTLYFDDISAEEYTGFDVVDANGCILTDIGEISGEIGVITSLAEKGDRVVLALYQEENGITKLKKFSIITSGGGKVLTDAVSDIENGSYTVKAFIWDSNMVPQNIKVLE